jgi:hypothetical protein
VIGRTWAERAEASWLARYAASRTAVGIVLYFVVIVARGMQDVGRWGDELENRVWPWSMR